MHIRRNWILGFILSVILMWAGSWPFVSNSTLIPYNWDSVVGTYVPRPGFEVRTNREGWAKTPYGKHGISCIPDVTVVEGPIVAIWGDSYVAGYQVPCETRVARQVTTISGERGDPLTGIPVAKPDRRIADHYFLLPAYEKLLKPICHVISLGGMGNVVPGSEHFSAEPSYHFVRDTRKPPTSVYHAMCRKLNLRFLYTAVRKLKRDEATGKDRGLRFTLGRAELPERRVAPLEVPPTEALDFVLNAFEERATRPVLFLYAPDVPSIRNQKIDFDDRHAPVAEAFRRRCEEHGVPFIDLTERFRAFYRSTGEFPRGFHNGFPSRGHWNENGHRIAAEAIVDYILEHKDAFYTD